VRTFPLEVMLFSFVLDAQLGFECGVPRLIAKLFELELVKGKNDALPAKESYNEAAAKLPVEIMQQALVQSHRLEQKANGKLFHGLNIIIPDGTKISMFSSPQTRLKYGEGQGHYVQSQALGFFELSTGTFQDFKFENCKVAERSIVLKHMQFNAMQTLYLADAGYNGMAFIAIAMEQDHELLMQLKSSPLAKKFLKTKKRSTLVEIKLTKVHLVSYPYHQHLLGQCITVRLIRTRGTSKLNSQALITTLLDEKTFCWQEITRLYLQRYTVELAFRHLKTKIRIEQIRKQKIKRIEQLLLSAIILFNLSAGIRNRIRRPSILPEKGGIKMHCFSLCIEMAHVFCMAAIRSARGMKKKMNLCLKAIKNCQFIYKPWRAEPRICHTPPSIFTAQKGFVFSVEVEKASFLTIEYEILGQRYGQIKAKRP
jgi:hypothetical protein